VAPAQSTIVAPDGTLTSARRPTDAIRPSAISTTPSGTAVASGDGCTRPPTSAMTLNGFDWAAPPAAPHPPTTSIATTQAIDLSMSEGLRSTVGDEAALFEYET